MSIWDCDGVSQLGCLVAAVGLSVESGCVVCGVRAFQFCCHLICTLSRHLGCHIDEVGLSARFCCFAHPWWEAPCLALSRRRAWQFSEGGSCFGLNACWDYLSISGVSAMQSEIFLRGRVACGLDAMSLLSWEFGLSLGRRLEHRCQQGG